MHQQNRDEYRGRCEVFVFAAAQNKWLFASERSLTQPPSSYKEVLAQATLETDAYVGSSLGWEHIFGIPFPSKEGEM